MSEEKKYDFAADIRTDYTVMELIGQLSQDESWESDPEIRQGAIGLLIHDLPSL